MHKCKRTPNARENNTTPNTMSNRYENDGKDRPSSHEFVELALASQQMQHQLFIFSQREASVQRLNP